MANKKSLGYLIKRYSKEAGTYFSGKVGDQSIVVFVNTRKRSPYEPDYIIYEDESQEK